MAFNDAVLKGLQRATLMLEGTASATIYNASRRVTGVAAGANLDSVFITGALPVLLFERNIGRSGLGVVATIYRGPTYTGGTDALIYSTNDIVGDGSQSTIQLKSGVTTTATGTQSVASSFAIGNTSNQGQGGIAEIGQPLLMLPNTTYLLRITSLDTSTMDVTSFLSWREGVL